MALQASGTIKFSEVQTEFGGTNPISISEYYGSDTVPASGVISLSDFFGTSAGAIDLQSATASEQQFISSATATLTAEADGETSGQGNLILTVPNWWTGAPDVGIGSNYEIRATVALGDTPTSGSLNTWLSLSVDRTWGLTRTVTGTSSCQLTIEIRDANTLTVLDTATWVLTANLDDI